LPATAGSGGDMSDARMTKRKARKQRLEPTNPLVTRGPKSAADLPAVKAILLREWERFFPDATYVEDLDEKDRKFWIRLREAIVRDHQAFSKLMAAVTDSLTQELSSEIRDREERRVAELKEERKKREGRERRKDKRLDQELKERDRFLLLTTVSVVATPVLGLVGAVTGAPIAYVGTGLGFLVSGGGLFGLRRSGGFSRRKKPKP
jgi:hypothetical protein